MDSLSKAKEKERIKREAEAAQRRHDNVPRKGTKTKELYVHVEGPLEFFVNPALQTNPKRGMRIKIGISAVRVVRAYNWSDAVKTSELVVLTKERLQTTKDPETGLPY